MDRNKVAVDTAKIKQEILKDPDKFIKKYQDLERYKQIGEAKIAGINAKYGKEGLLKNFKDRIWRLADLEHQIKTATKDDKNGIWEPLNKNSHEYLTKTINMLISEAEYIKHQIKMDILYLKEDAEITDEEIEQAKQDAFKGRDAYEYYTEVK